MVAVPAEFVANAIQGVAALRIGYVGEKDGKSAAGRAWSSVLLIGEGTLSIGDQKLACEGLVLNQFKRGDNDAVYSQLVELQRGDLAYLTVHLTEYRDRATNRTSLRWSVVGVERA